MNSFTISSSMYIQLSFLRSIRLVLFTHSTFFFFQSLDTIMNVAQKINLAQLLWQRRFFQIFDLLLFCNVNCTTILQLMFHLFNNENLISSLNKCTSQFQNIVIILLHAFLSRNSLVLEFHSAT